MTDTCERGSRRPFAAAYGGPLSAIALVGALAFGGPSAEGLEAQQSLRYTSQTSMELGGALGRALQGIPGLSSTQSGDPETIYIFGNRMRTDTGSQSTILDLEVGRFLSVNHETREYILADLGDLAGVFAGADAATSEAMEELEMTLEEIRAELEAAREEMEEEGIEMNVRISTDRTGERSTLQGLDVERVLLTLEIETLVEQEDDAPLEGSFVVLSDLWTAPGTSAELEAATELWQALGESLAETSTMQSMASLEQAFALDPRIELAMEENREAIEALDGLAMKSTTHFVLVPPGLSFDREAVLAEAERSLSDDLREGAGEQARGAAAGAARDAVRGRLGGMFGRGGGDEEEEEEPEEETPAQGTVLRIVQEITEFDRSALSADLFDAPADYRPVPLNVGAPAGT